MWMIELNILGRRFTREVSGPQGHFKLDSRQLPSRFTQFLRPGAAA